MSTNLQPPEPEREREPLPTVADWLAMTDDEMIARFRASARTVDDVPADVRARTEVLLADIFRAEGVTGDEARAGLARLRADALARDAGRVHFDLDTIEERAACGYDLGVQGPDGWSTDPARVTCPVCTASIVDSQLPPEPVDETDIRFALADDLRRMGLMPEPVDEPVEAARRTVGLEVLTDEQRARYSIPKFSKVGIVLRTDGELGSIIPGGVVGPELAAESLFQLLRIARDVAQSVIEPELGGELLMPTPDVLAALAGTPVGRYTASVPSRYSWVKPGWYVRAEITLADGSRDVVWQLVDAVAPCTEPECVVSGGAPEICVVVTVRGRGEQHIETYQPVSVRIPATTEVEE